MIDKRIDIGIYELTITANSRLSPCNALAILKDKLYEDQTRSTFSDHYVCEKKLTGLIELTAKGQDMVSNSLILIYCLFYVEQRYYTVEVYSSDKHYLIFYCL